MLRNLIRLYADLNNGDYKEGLNEFCSEIESESKTLISELINKPMVLGKSLNFIISKSIEDIPFLANLMFYAIMGKNSKDIWSKPELFKEENGVYKITLHQKTCILCAEENQLTQEDFKEARLGNIMALLFKGIVQAIIDYVGNPYDVTAEETKCFMLGDSYGETTLWLTPRK